LTRSIWTVNTIGKAKRNDHARSQDASVTRPLILHADRLLPADPATRALARDLYAGVKDLQSAWAY
jgi:hypothetical protein